MALLEREFKEMKLDLDWTKNAPTLCLQPSLRPGEWIAFWAGRFLVLPKGLRYGYRKCSRCSKWFFARSQNPRHRFCSMTCRVAYQRRLTPDGRARNKEYRREWRKCQKWEEMENSNMPEGPLRAARKNHRGENERP